MATFRRDRVPTPEEVAAHRIAMAERIRSEKQREEFREHLFRAGFIVDVTGQLKSQPHILVKMVEAKVDTDFYYRGDHGQ